MFKKTINFNTNKTATNRSIGKFNGFEKDEILARDKT